LAVFWEVAPFIAVENEKTLTGIYCHQLSTTQLRIPQDNIHPLLNGQISVTESYILVTLIRYEQWKSDETYSVNKKN